MCDDLRKKHWNSLEATKIVLALITPILVAIIGFQINRSFREIDEARQGLEQTRAQSQARQAAVLTLSRFIYERRARAEMLASSLRRYSENHNVDSRIELKERKKQYDEAFVSWNASNQANLLLVRQVLGSDKYSEFEQIVESRLVKKTFKPLDRCLTEAYDVALQGGDARPLLVKGKSSALLQRALDCGYAITDALFRLSGPTGDRERAVNIVERRCPPSLAER